MHKPVMTEAGLHTVPKLLGPILKLEDPLRTLPFYLQALGSQ